MPHSPSHCARSASSCVEISTISQYACNLVMLAQMRGATYRGRDRVVDVVENKVEQLKGECQAC